MWIRPVSMAKKERTAVCAVPGRMWASRARETRRVCCSSSIKAKEGVCLAPTLAPNQIRKSKYQYQFLSWTSYMGRRRKNRTHLKGASQRDIAASNVPKSFIIKHGQVGSSITQLVRDMRKVMEPNTASRLKVRSGPFTALQLSSSQVC